MLIFKNKPDTSTPINASNLNANFEELDGNIGDLGSLETSDKTNIVDAINELNDDIKIVEYTQTYSISTGSGTYGRVAFNTNTPSGYEWVGYVIISNGYVNSAVAWIISSSATQCQVAWYNVSNSTYSNLTMSIKGIYKKV